MIALTASRLLTPLDQIQQPFVLVEDGFISEIGSRADRTIPNNARVVDFGDATLVPGFIDIHIHGGGGRDVMETTSDGLVELEQLLVRHGVSSYFPTTVTAPESTILIALDRLADAIEAPTPAKGVGARARPVGIHLEGPFISHARRGVHPPEHLLPPTQALFDRFWQASRGHIRLMTIAPELDGALDLIAEATRRGVCVSVGHSDADLGSARAAVAAGAVHATHTFNAMRPLSHRDPGIVGLVLTNQKITADIIADGIHVDPAVVELFLKVKGPDGAVLITDATSATDMPDGHYRLGSFELEMKDGKCVAGGKLAGSILTMDRAVRNVMQFAHVDLACAVRAATFNPAKVAGLCGQKGVLKPGAQADIVILNAQHHVIKTIVGGTGI